EFGRWKVNSLAVEKRDSFGDSGGLALPLDPDLMHTIRQLGRRPTLQMITESLIKKYGTHLLLSATLGAYVALILPCAACQAANHIMRFFSQKNVVWLTKTSKCLV
ncbi:BMP/retinoic acid-inducible neural-specific protein 3, partial [Ataeniobius toweri]|nr:BMP/retinoic acid-inducible neural-specific protein 3 [Ataeniobius toweri]